MDSAGGAPLAGAVVTAAERYARTDAEGRFSLTVPAGTHTLRVRMLGYAPAVRTVTVEPDGAVSVELALAAQALGLAEVVVTGYGTQRAGELTGAVTQLTAGEFNTGRIVSPEELIRSKVAGVQVVDNNEPGGGLSIRIRGATSVNASSEPLVVIDGFPVTPGSISAGRNPLNFLNPDDIESITVLKDASAAAIYGANAANGVILIETKSGAGRPQFEYSASMSASSVDRLPSMLNAQQFRAAVMQYADTLQQNQLLGANTNWFDLVTRTAVGQEHNFAMSGSGESMNWRLSAGYLNQEGVIRGTTVERLSLGLSFRQRLFDDRLDVRANLRGSRAEDEFTPDGVITNAAQMGPTQPVYDPTSPTGFYEWPGNRLTSADNPVAILHLARHRGTTYRSLCNARIELRPPLLEGLRVVTTLGFDVAQAERQTFTPSVLHSQTKTGTGGSDYRTRPSQANATLESYVTYSAAPGPIPGTLDVTGGYSYAQSRREFPWFLAQGLSTDVLQGEGIPTARTVQNDEDIAESRLVSFFGRLNYNLDDRYLAAVSVRRDGSSRFGPAHAWGTFPAVALAWRLSQEPFLAEARALSDLKLRAAWGKTGNQSFADYQQYAAYVLGDAQTQVQFGSEFVSTIRPSAFDPTIRWEETTSWNVGVDFGFFNQRVYGAVDWYTKTTEDLIFTVPVAAGTNLSNYVTTNIGSMRNRGVELSLNARVLEGRGGRAGGLTWTADFTAAYNRNELLTINPIFGDSVRLQQILTGGVSGGVGTLIQVLRPGSPINSFFVYKHRRGPDGRPVYADRDGNGVITDLDIYEDLNADGVINQDDRRPFHDPAPKWILGHSSYLTWGNFDLSLTLRAYLGNYVYNNVASNLGTYEEVRRGSPYNLHSSVLETGFRTPQYLSDYYVEDASFLRLDNVTLAYSFAYRGQPARVFGSLQNAVTLTGYSGVDPTAGLNGLDNNIYPRARTFTAGLTVRF